MLQILVIWEMWQNKILVLSLFSIWAVYECYVGSLFSIWAVYECYVGSTAQKFKKRYYKHRSSFQNPKYEHDTELSKHIWKLKRENKTYRIKWKVIDRAAPYNPVTKRCNLCNKEKFYIVYKRSMATLNKRKEIYTVCRHRVKTLLANS